MKALQAVKSMAEDGKSRGRVGSQSLNYQMPSAKAKAFNVDRIQALLSTDLGKDIG